MGVRGEDGAEEMCGRTGHGALDQLLPRRRHDGGGASSGGGVGQIA